MLCHWIFSYKHNSAEMCFISAQSFSVYSVLVEIFGQKPISFADMENAIAVCSLQDWA